MHPWLRLICNLLIALALPVQGWASAARVHCTAVGQLPAAAAVHEHGGHHHPAVDADTADGTQAHKCSACAACHAGAALLPQMPAVPEAGAVPAEFAPLNVSIAPMAREGPERPPRTALA